MKRRTLIASIATVGVAGCIGSENNGNDSVENDSSSNDTEPLEEIPEEVEAIQPLAQSFTETIHEHYADARVFISTDAELAMEYSTSKESEDALESEIHQIADLYADVVDEIEQDGVTLSIITGQVQGIVPADTVNARVNGNLEQDAFHETIGITGVERRDE